MKNMIKLTQIMAAAVLLTGCTSGNSGTDDSTVPGTDSQITSTQETENTQTVTQTEAYASDPASNPSDTPANPQNSTDEHSIISDEQKPEVPDEAPTESEIANINMDEWD